MKRLALPLLLSLGTSCLGAAHAAPRYVLSVTPTAGEVRVVVGTRLLRFRAGDPRARDVGELLRLGGNFVRIGWTNVRAPAEVTFTRLGEGRPEVLLRYRLDGVLKPVSGALNLAVVRGDTPGGGARLGAFMSKGLARVSLNGKSLGDCASLEGRDVTAWLRSGHNELRVTWSKDFGASLPSGEIALTEGGQVLARWRASDSASLSGTRLIPFAYQPREVGASARREGE